MTTEAESTGACRHAPGRAVVTAKVIEFRQPEGPKTQREEIIQNCKKRFAETFNRTMPDDLAQMLADRIISAPPLQP